ncbi:glycoside hydrolase family 6 protein [Nocardioides jishulii]|uniref:Glucanase n=1 Tax=Nocardioides jishulii TaxID=2575440 RepID=A0A4U2YUL3_9ACTN|nr:glycoside hydrolase family 6 protein [Nocardioides jishulii]QCX28472.1 hypothetical protein FCL41_13755 [Nocardioides jishulii]TKI64635.1 hypothetical protein FC770_05820 [Nocardioides jishulii]
MALSRLALLASAGLIVAALSTPTSDLPDAAASAGALKVVKRTPSGDYTANGNKIMRAGSSSSELAGTWGVYNGPADMASVAYEKGTKAQRADLRWLINQPRAGWMGSWIPDGEIAAKTRRYIELSQNGDPDALVQVTIFRMDPWYTASKKKAPTKKQIASYKRWIRASAAAIGDTPTALMLQPDATFLRTVPNFKLSSRLIRFAAKEYGALTNTRVYLETGGWDWPSPGQGGVKEAVRLLTAMGMQHADGVVTNTTHYNKTAWDVQRVADISEAFAKKGLRGRKGIVNTSSNGKGFEFGRYTGKDPDHAFVCGKKLKGTCVTLGIPPTTDVANPVWGLDEKTRQLAKKYVDAYMWVGRPWLKRQTSPFMMKRTRKLIKYSPYRGQ